MLRHAPDKLKCIIVLYLVALPDYMVIVGDGAREAPLRTTNIESFLSTLPDIDTAVLVGAHD